jgi:hypothetical protein
MTNFLTAPLDAIPLPILFFAFAGLLWLAMESGYRFGRWRRLRIADEKEQPVGAMVASILGLVALVLGFTFSLAAGRFDARRMAVLEEANAIGTTYLRSRLLPDEQRREVARLLREYVALRIEAVQTGDAEGALVRTEEIHEQLWQQATSAAAQDTGSIMTGIFIQSLNDVIDIHAKRILFGLRSRIPLVIWAGLFGLAMLGIASIGYQSGLSATRRSPAMLCLIISFAIVLLLIADLDRGQEGLLQVSQQAMTDLQTTIAAEIPAPHEPGNGSD